MLKSSRKIPAGPLFEWFDSPFGEYLLASEHSAVSKALQGQSGYHLMQLSSACRSMIDDQADYSHTFMLNAQGCPDSGHAVVDFSSLPLPGKTIDTAILHHVLEFSSNPHQLLGEAARVIAPGGHMVLIVFNPYSLFGLSRLIMRYLSDRPVWQCRSLRYGRVMDWLKLLGFQPLYSARGCYQVPTSWASWLRRTAFLQRLDEIPTPVGGSYYLILARKQVAPLTPSGKPLWHSLGKTLVSGTEQSPACRKQNKIENQLRKQH